MSEQAAPETETDTETPPARTARPWFTPWHWLAVFFKGLQNFTERVMSLLRFFVTAIVFLVVAFVIYNAWVTRNTVAVKSFQVPVSMGENNHRQAGRIIANLLNRHLLETQDTLQEQLNREGQIYIDKPVAAEEQVLLEGESIKLPETGITIDNVIEFISGLFGRKNLHGSVYFEPDPEVPDRHKLYLQITLKGHILSLSEDDLGQTWRDNLPATQPAGLNIQLISAMLKVRSKEILSIASEDYNLYYFCTRDTPEIAHKQGEYRAFFGYCRDVHNAGATPSTLQALRDKLKALDSRQYANNIVGSVIGFLQDEAGKKQATLCQSAANQQDPACQPAKLSGLTKTRPLALPRIKQMSPVIPDDASESANVSYTVGHTRMIENIIPVSPAIGLGSMEALYQQCEQARISPAETGLDVVPPLERACFSQNPAQQQKLPGASPEAVLQANQLEGDATQLLRNGLYQEALAKFQSALSLNCNNAVAWANMGILLSTASEASGVRDVNEGQCALVRAIRLNDSAGWMRHSLCVAQAQEGKADLERFLDYESCRLARQLEPINETLYDKLFYLDIGDRYRKLGKSEQAVEAYAQAMINESQRSCRMKSVLESLQQLQQAGTDQAGQQACAIYQNSQPGVAQETVPECEADVDKLARQLGCI